MGFAKAQRQAEQSLLTQFTAMQQQSDQATANFQAQQNASAAALRTKVAAEQKTLDQSIKKKIAKPMKLGTLKTSPLGLFLSNEPATGRGMLS